MTDQTPSSAPSPPSLSLLTTLHPPTPGAPRAWQSLPHPDPSTPLLATASADKSVNVWSLRDFSLISTISGGHKRSVRAVGWKDFGNTPRQKNGKKDRRPVVLATGSFDANVGIWVWNDSRRWARFRHEENDRANEEHDAQEAEEMDMAHDPADEEDGNEEWHFSTLLTGPDSEIKSIEFSPPHYPANLLATSSRDKSVWIWEEVEPEEWETIAVLSEHTGDVKCVGWCKGARRGRKRRRVENANTKDGDVDMENTNTQPNGTAKAADEDSEDDQVLGARPVLASGSYDDTIRLWRDVEEEGDWICVGVIDGHAGTVWDVQWEGHISYSLLDLRQTTEQDNAQAAEHAVAEFEADWMPRIVSCSDDMSVRIWRRELSDAERQKRSESRSTAPTPTGFASSRLPSVIRPPSAMEKWVEDATLPSVHVRSVYAIDWSERTGLVVSCGGDGTIAVYREVPVVESSPGQSGGEDIVMNGTTPAPEREASGSELPYKLHKSRWEIVALMEGAHDEYEINHVCWAGRRDKDRRWDGEEMIVSTGDEGDVRVWILPEGVGRED